MNTTARAALSIGAIAATFAGTGAVVLLLSRDLHATGTGRTLWLVALTVAAYLVIDWLIDVATRPLVDRLHPQTSLVSCGTPGCPVEIELSGRLHVEDDDRLITLATDHSKHHPA
ncbi:hypothetical protein GCM10023347_33800 [Streptomyces chumphonensis]|uniref:Uncharacterized protein n=1 Tax=Streptomyces chumphonensis TaxID=1214925 RepID=A0A927ICT0_9ACTN|nr:hypothetical protein [Streptomyces chumphonensis]MBD3931949.1 hypothetical protein [Streptomyces chumphonensis]